MKDISLSLSYSFVKERESTGNEKRICPGVNLPLINLAEPQIMKCLCLQRVSLIQTVRKSKVSNFTIFGIPPAIMQNLIMSVIQWAM